MKDKPMTPSKREKRPDKFGARSGHADARGDFHFDELMTPQPDAIREYHRAQLLKPMRVPGKKKP